MKEFIFQLISSVLQILFCLLIPFLFFLFRKKKEQSFWNYIGFYKPGRRSFLPVLLTMLIFLAAGVGLALFSEMVRAAVLSPHSVTGRLRMSGLNFYSILILLLVAIFKTALAEEIFFRGFLEKRLMYVWGFTVANIIQSLLFGFVHLILFYALTHAAFPFLLFIFVFSALAGWVTGFINERYAGGSIIPGWMAHATGNCLAYFILGFLI